VLVAADSAVEGVDDLVGRKVCAVSGTTSIQEIARRKATPVAVKNWTDCLVLLQQNQVVAISTDNVILAGLAAQNEGEFKVVGEPFTEEPYGIGVKKGDNDFRNFINDTLEAAVKDGRYLKAWQATAGTVATEDPTPPAVDRY
jgi:glutamate transport system substrate-binding protein